VASAESIRVVLGGVVIAETATSWRVLETSHPPTYYLPRDAFIAGSLVPAAGTSYCEWKGVAQYLDVVGGAERRERAAWTYPTPFSSFAAIAGWVSLYPGQMDEVTVDAERVRAQDGGFYGGWVTDRVVGPFKGGPGSSGW
jgi:uncharacterized protein (DUF427 family)